MLAKGSFAWVGSGLLLAIITGYLSKLNSMLFFLFIPSITITIFFLIFFRDPERIPSGEEDDMVSPADGRIISIGERSLSVFMNIHNVHVNRAPLSGKVKHIDYKPGGYLPAFNKNSDVNERNHIVMQSDYGILELTQIAGALTRRIVSYICEGIYIRRGERIGMIRFGSRVDVVIPEDYTIIVKKGDKVKAGETIIAVRKQKIKRREWTISSD